MATVTGYVERIKYRNEDNGYSVLSVADGGEEYVLVGTFPYISEGERIEATGRMVEHSIYGEQLAVESYEIKAPEDTLAIERYLGSGAIKGIGAALAKRIVKKFKADTFRIMEEEPERLAEVKGVSERMAMEICSQVEEKRDMRQAMVFLQQYGISMNLAVKIYQHYGPKMYSVIQENPYQLADDIQGVGFKIADEIAAKVGIFTDSDYRIRSGLFYALLQATGNGHTYLPEEELFANASALLNVEPEHMEKHLVDLQMEKKLVVKEKDGKQIVYPAQFYYMELNTARMLHDLNLHSKIDEEDIVKALRIIKNRKGPILIHCWHGSDRTGAVIAMYRIVFQGWSKENAIKEMTEEGFGFHRQFSQIIDMINRADIAAIKRKLEAKPKIKTVPAPRNGSLTE